MSGDLDARTLRLTAGVDDGKMLLVENTDGVERFSVDSDANVLVDGVNLSSTYADRLTVPAPALRAGGGAVLGTVGGGFRYGALFLDASATEWGSASISLPAGWDAVNVDIYWTNNGAGSGNVVWSIAVDRAGDGETLNASSGGGSTIETIAAPAQDVLKVSRLFTGLAVDPSKFYSFRIVRVGGDAADTLANDVGLLGMSVEAA